jgi:hypothetical protein
MADRKTFSAKLLARPEAKNEAVLDRIAIAKGRIQSILDQYTVAHQKTLEQKIAEQGPDPQRVDPHLIGLAIVDLIELNRLRRHRHQSSSTKSWFANPATTEKVVSQKLDKLGPLYRQISTGGFGNLTGDALELVVFKTLHQIFEADPAHAYQGAFHLDRPKDSHGRYRKTQPPKHIGPRSTVAEADFLQYGHKIGPLCIECKNRREWIYPTDTDIKELILKSHDLGAIPVLVARRLHYTTRTNLLEPAGIIAHETFLQYYPADKAKIAEQVRDKGSLGFTDVTAAEEPHPRTIKFFSSILPKISDRMGNRWKKNEAALLEYARGEINLAQLYNAIGSPGAGNWIDEQFPE